MFRRSVLMGYVRYLVPTDLYLLSCLLLSAGVKVPCWLSDGLGTSVTNQTKRIPSGTGKLVRFLAGR